MKNGKRKAESFIRGTGVVAQTGAGAMWRDGHSVSWFPFESTDRLAKGLQFRGRCCDLEGQSMNLSFEFTHTCLHFMEIPSAQGVTAGWGRRVPASLARRARGARRKRKLFLGNLDPLKYYAG